MGNNPFFNGDVGLGFLLFLVNDALRRLREKELAKYPLTFRQRGTMLAIKASRDEATLAIIAQNLIRRPHTISNIVSRMERQGLVRKKRQSRIHARSIIELTERGNELYYQTSAAESIQQIMRSLSEQEREQLRHLLKKVLRRSVREL